MFKEKLHSDIDRLSPSPELLDKISLMMREEAEKRRPKPYMAAVRFGGVAAAVCLLAFGAIRLGMAREALPEIASGGAYETEGGAPKITEYNASAETANQTRAVATTAAATTAAAGQTAAEDGGSAESEEAYPSEKAVGADRNAEGLTALPPMDSADYFAGDSEEPEITETASSTERYQPAPEVYTSAAEPTQYQSAYTIEDETGFAPAYDDSDGFSEEVPTADQAAPAAEGAAGAAEENAGAAEEIASAAEETVQMAEDPAPAAMDDMHMDSADMLDASGGVEIAVPTPSYLLPTVTDSTEIWTCDRAALTFEETAEKIREKEELSLYRLKITEILPEGEVPENSRVNFANGETYYRAEAENLLTGEKSEITAAFAGTAEAQELGNPCYQAGDELLCAGEARGETIIIREYPLFDLYETETGTAACLRICAMDIPGAENYAPEGFELVTTTGNNPARYYGIYLYDEIASAFVNEILS